IETIETQNPLAAPHAADRFTTRVPKLAWRMSWRLIGWWPGLITLALLACILIFIPVPDRARAVEIVAPLLIGIHAALLFAPDDEPALELLLAAPRPLIWLLIERLAVLFLLHLPIVIAGWLLLVINHPNLYFAVDPLRWIAPTILLTGVALYITQLNRRSSFGVLVVIAVYGPMLFGGDLLVTEYPFLWPVHLFLWPGFETPDLLITDALYLANRLIISLIGLGLLAVVLQRLRDTEKVLGI
ncbi:MAG: hypothetical protein GYB67_18195, partial [Chloroflexi bacterium]|nr:hypothetical protein [Chloroflexota bacterium]